MIMDFSMIMESGVIMDFSRPAVGLPNFMIMPKFMITLKFMITGGVGGSAVGVRGVMIRSSAGGRFADNRCRQLCRCGQ